MLFILLSWIYILAITLVAGVSINRLLKLQDVNHILVLFHGLFGISLLAGFWSVFSAINWQFCTFLLFFIIVLIFVNTSQIKNYINSFKHELEKLSKFFKMILIVIFILVLAQSASPPFLLDNESYYIQTIAWLNEFGFVNGLINLHLFLGQTSGWHILQSAFNFSFLYNNFNDINGLCLLLGNYYVIVKLNEYYKYKSNPLNLVVGLFPIFNVFLFQFDSSPSPDLAVYVLSLIVFYGFLMNYHACSKNGIVSLVILTSFLILIKATTLVFVLFPLIIYIKHYKHVKQYTFKISMVVFLTISLIIIKNILITGNPIYPLAGIEGLKASWSLPTNIETYFYNYAKAYGYAVTPEVYNTSSYVTLIKGWILQTGIDGLFNKLILLVLVLFLLFLKKFKSNKAILFIYGIAWLQLFILFITSPQFRFYVPFLLILSLFLIAEFIKSEKIVKSILVVSTILITIPLFFTIPNLKTSTFLTSYLIEPHENSQFKTEYKTLNLENTQINTPTNIEFFWGTGNTKLPALNKQQLDYFKTHFKVMPQQRTENLKDGFYLKEID
ncbi:LIC_10190 family membrane protein [Xanthomarina spongicola]|uniref:DUF8201 domain-containing protein n=1 Tax=Xanthomarina spongicola TaxID=570520 RepID=A0A316DP17_9FLAO|nr:hypothetical protein [Xanthomarina spongicola]PWK19801.1 hypothetical protein LX78_01151 [Xanthomarina spongicola]